MYGDQIDMDALENEANIFWIIMSICKVENKRIGFKYVYNKMKSCPESEKDRTPNIMRIKKLLLTQ